MSSTSRTVVRTALGGLLVTAGIGHLTWARREFRAQVPEFVPLDPDTTVLASGVVEVALGSALLLAKKRRRLAGRIAAAFFVAVFPGNLSQFANRRDGFGLNTDVKRLLRLPFQIVLIWAALFGTKPARNTRN